MDPSIPTSFIPKRPVTSEPMRSSSGGGRSVGLLTVVTVVIVIATLVSFGGVYLYEQRLVSQKSTLEDSINTARDDVGSEFVADMQRLNARITGVQELLGAHVVVSPIFSALEDTTLRSIQYEDFKYEIGADPATKAKIVKVTLKGNAKSYSTIALQSDAFAQSSLIKNPVFSNLTIDDKGSKVSFSLNFTVAMEDLSYQKFFDSLNAGQGQAAPTITPQ